MPWAIYDSGTRRIRNETIRQQRTHAIRAGINLYKGLFPGGSARHTTEKGEAKMRVSGKMVVEVEVRLK